MDERRVRREGEGTVSTVEYGETEGEARRGALATANPKANHKYGA